jgi:alpha 1,6-mannosyltransferase
MGRRRGCALLTFSAFSVFCLITLGYLFIDTTETPYSLTPPGQGQSLTVEALIPRLIWQIFFPPAGEAIIPTDLLHSNDWVSMGPGYTYTMVGDLEAARLIDQHFSDRPEIAATYHNLINPANKSDFLRYLLLLTRGGTYSDVDTKPVVRLEDWIPAERRATTRLIVAVEYDEAQDPHPADFTYPVQFCQWTIAAAPNHTVLDRMVDRALGGLRDLAAAQRTNLGTAVFSEFDVLNTTGPVAWTEVVYRTLREIDPTITSYADLAGIRTPRYIGDIAVLPLESFRADYLDDWGWSWRNDRNALVRHFFEGGWKSKPDK